MQALPAGPAVKIMAAALLALMLAGCAGTSAPMNYGAMPPEYGSAQVHPGDGRQMNCVPFAREHSTVKIFGDAVAWWDRAAGHYTRGQVPEAGSVMVLHDYAGPKHGHVAVVRKVVSNREIRVDHANWLNDGAVYLNDPVADVSRDNDWSQVRIWNIPGNAWGVRVYPVQGFIGPGATPAATARGGTMGPAAFAGE
jgi:surface antigen